MILCALARHDYVAARECLSNMSDTGRDDRITRYLMYKVGLHSGDAEFSGYSQDITDDKLIDTAAECLDLVCRQSSKDATLLYACALEAKGSGNRREAIAALEKVLDKYDHAVPADVHLPTLLRSVLPVRLHDFPNAQQNDSKASDVRANQGRSLEHGHCWSDLYYI